MLPRSEISKVASAAGFPVLERALEDGEAGPGVQPVVHFPENARLYAELRATQDRLDGALRDNRRLADELKRTQDELGRSEARLQAELTRVSRIAGMGALTASIAHEVSQPLAGIVTNAGTCMRLLTAGPPRVERARQTVKRILRDAERAGLVIARLRALFANQSSTIEAVDMNEATREVLALSSSELRRNRISVRSELAGDLPAVTGDRIQLEQVIANLILNASEAMSGVEGRKRLLSVRTEREGTDHVRVVVQDTGVGLAPDVEMLFAAFYTTKNSGMGIGLSVSRAIIESHGGRLSAAPNGHGPGATFSFSIPVWSG